MMALAPVLVVLAVSAADSNARALTLDEAVALAERNAPIVIAAEGAQRISDAQARAGLAAFLPSVSVSAGASRQLPSAGGRTRIDSNGQIITLPDEPWSSNIGLSANVVLFSGGARWFNLKQTRARAVAAGVSTQSQRFAATLAVKQQFFNVLAARESEAAARAQVEQAEQQLKMSVARVRARTATRSDSLRSEIQRRNAQLAVMVAHNALVTANASLRRATGATGPVTAAPTDSLPAPALAVPDEALEALALAGPDVREAEANLKAARAARSSSWSRYLPSLSAGYSRSGNGASSDFDFGTSGFGYTGSLRFSLSLPIFDQLQREAQVTQASVAERNAEVDLADARLAALESLTQSLGAFRSAEQRVVSQSASVEAADEDLRVQQQRYAVGGSTLVDVLTSQTALDQARGDLIRARYDQRVAQAQLEALVGRKL